MRGRGTFAVGLIGAIAIALTPIAAHGFDPAPTATSVGLRVAGDNLHIGGTVLPAQPGGPVSLTVLRSKTTGAPYKRVRSTETTINLEGSYAAKVRRKRKGNCQLVAEWAGDADSLPSSASVGFRC